MINDAQRAQHEQWLMELTQIPTASGREHRVIEWITRWCRERPGVQVATDRGGNLTLSLTRSVPSASPTYFTAHLDHPAFVVEAVESPTSALLSFRGGVMAEYFVDGRVVLFGARTSPTNPESSVRGTLQGKTGTVGPFDVYRVSTQSAFPMNPGDVGVWDVGPARVEGDLIYTLACDDLAAAAAALSAFDALLRLSESQPIGDVRVLFTRAEEIGFVGAISACREGTIPKHARVIALENSRSFPESPIGGGPIVRVGDRLSVFSPTLTDAVAKRAEQIAGGPSSPTASQKLSSLPAWKWQRKLMAGGACEASVFCAAGLEATCVCLPLGNYHNMADLTAVQAGTNIQKPVVGPEYISLSDYRGLVDLLVACGLELPSGVIGADRFEKLWTERGFVLNSVSTPEA